MATASNSRPERRRACHSAEYRAEALALPEKSEEVEILGKTAANFAKRLD